MFWIFADYANYALALDNFALVTHLLYRRTNFHSSLLKIYSTLGCIRFNEILNQLFSKQVVGFENNSSYSNLSQRAEYSQI